MENENLEKTLNELTNALEANEKTIDMAAVAAIRVTDQMESAKKYLSQLATTALSKTSKTLIAEEQGQAVARCTFFGAAVANGNLEAAIKKMAEIANELADKGLIHSVLAPISSLQLAHMAGQVETSAVFFYPLVPLDKVPEVEKIEFSLKEGENPKILGSVEIELPQGEFYATIKLAHHLTRVVKSSIEVSGELHEAVNEFLKVLPPGTVFLGSSPRAIVDLSIPYEARFYNPLLQKVKRVELQHFREIAIFGDEIKQFNILAGIRYFDADNEPLYSR